MSNTKTITLGDKKLNPIDNDLRAQGFKSSKAEAMGFIKAPNPMDVFEGFEEEPTFELKDFPMPSEGTTIDLKDFLKVPTFPINRDVEHRAKKAVTRLTKAMHKHAEVDLLHYTGPTTSTPAFFQHGATYVLDGNTRQHIWKRHYSDKQVVNTNVKSIPVPSQVAVRTYEIDDPYEACSLYYIIDSVDAVETKADKITGAFRAKNLLNTFKNPKLKRGQIGGALNVGCPYGGKSLMQTPGVKDLHDQVDILADTLTHMDKLNAPGNGHFHVQPATGMAILAGVAMDCSDEWLGVIDELASTDIKLYRYEDSDFSSSAVDALVAGNVQNPVNVHNALPYDIGYGQNPAVVLNYLAFCWNCIINGTEVPEFITEVTIANAYYDLWSSVYLRDTIV
jgi:hypothetical protein